MLAGAVVLGGLRFREARVHERVHQLRVRNAAKSFVGDRPALCDDQPPQRRAGPARSSI